MALEEGKKKGADIVVFPEMSICGYPTEDLVLHNDFVVAVEGCLEKIAPKTKGIMAVVGVVRRNLARGEKALLNSAAIFQEGKLIGFHDKWLLPTYDVFDERRYFEMGRDLHVWEWKGERVAVLICEDMWQHAGYVGYTRYPCDPVEELIGRGPDVLLNIGASPYHFQKPDIRVKVAQKSAKTLKCPVVMCCQVGGNDQLVFDGYSIHMGREGELQQLAKGFTEDFLWVDTDAPEKPHTFTYDAVGDMYRALVLGMRDYFHKQGFKKAVLGLSGGIDSSVVACIANDALGEKNVLGLRMPSQYSSPGSIADAETLAKNLNLPFETISIKQPYNTYLELLQPYFQEKPFDVTEENLQARIRGMILMAFSNKLGFLVLSTGNKSEMAMGYCTLYGDMAGGLAVLSDVSKTQVYALARWINRNREVIPRSCIEKVPSAELRPNQKDSDTLPDFSVLDTILQEYVENLLSPEEISKKHEIPLDLVIGIIKRIHKAEYKRRQAPPGIRVTKKSFMIGRRYPIVQGWIK
jgi:NAD+ synthase (glutamine-hydrolysing)